MSAPAAAATAAAWLARLPAAERAAAHAATDLRLAGWATSAALAAIVCAALARSGLLAALRRSIEAERPRPWLTSGALAGFLVLALALVHAPAAAFFAWRETATLALGGGAQAAAGYGAHLGQALAGVAPAVLAALVLAPPLYFLMRRASKFWPAIAGGGVLVLVLAAGWLPYALALEPTAGLAPPGSARDGVMRLAAEIGLPTREVWLSADPAFDADVEGAFGRAKIIVGPTLLGAPAQEARAFVGHVAGHYAHADVFWACVIYGAVLGGGFFGLNRWAGPLARRLGAHVKQGPADPEAMPGAALIAIVAFACAGLAAGAYLRWANVRADAYSLAHVHEPDGLAAVIEREWDHASVDPSPLERALFYTHPPIASRLKRIAAWKADHPAAAFRDGAALQPLLTNGAEP